MGESSQTILKRRALADQDPKDMGVFHARFEAMAQHRNPSPTPFEWSRKRTARQHLQ